MKAAELVSPAAAMESAVARATQLAAEQAEAVDREGRLPTEVLDALRAQGLMGLLVPTRYGGPGLPLRAVVNVCRRLSEACASTGLIYAMHQSQSAVAIGHAQDSDWLQGLLARMASEQLLVASATTEGATGGAIRASACFLDPQPDGHLRLRKSGAVISYAPAADVFLVSARRAEDAAPTDQRLVAVRKDQIQLQAHTPWNPMGMRGARTDRYDLIADCGPEQVYAEPFSVHMSQTMLPTSHLLLGAVWLGIAVSALGRARAFLRHRNRSGAPLNPIANLRLAEGETLVQQFRGTLAACMALYEDVEGPQTATERMVSYNALKVGASELVVRVTDIALRICGIQGYMEPGEFYLSRHIRDAHAAAVMVNDDRILGSLSTVVLGVPLNRDL
ncbi:acyl-CoA dehydrogenase family protein [uncultured Pseudacidovorax sp.]|uniref:acyl-CoA dehydrogenase family protein n=1 Tax=uncultured Pseudacidovorax sp. TaxID=679313 RepID=UPI0025F30EEC|nr:acyl-CoA dehydrogenase family protein [uncultured Pseudacidovorax sp.]